jgi:hypothetical protein
MVAVAQVSQDDLPPVADLSVDASPTGDEQEQHATLPALAQDVVTSPVKFSPQTLGNHFQLCVLQLCEQCC